MKKASIILIALVCILLVCAGCKAEDDIKPIITPRPNAPEVVVNHELVPPEHIIEVNGYGEVIATPDYATIMLGVQGTGETAEQASALCGENLQSAIDSIVALGVRTEDITTAGISITANTRESDGAVLGYVAADTITIIARDVAGANSLMSTVIDAGASDIHGITYSLTDAGPAYQAALEAAMADALTKATVLSTAGGVELGTVIGVTESPHDESKLIGVDFESSAIAVSAGVTVQYRIVD